jgi:hypothetical protein
LVSVAVEPALAQFNRSPTPATRPPTPATPPQTYNPAFSPYLNLLRRGTSTFYNYYNFVVPQLETQRAVNQLQQQINTNQQNIYTVGRNVQELQQQQAEPVGLPDTGRGVGFMTHGKWFGGSGGSRHR